MKWSEIGKNHWRSACKRYEIWGEYDVNERGPRRWYEGRRTRKHEDGPHCVCVEIDTLARCQALCEDDSRE